MTYLSERRRLLEQEWDYFGEFDEQRYRNMGWYVHSYDTGGTVLKYKKHEHSLLCHC
ncbi:hypothetical protein [Marinomonas sp. 2405UD68-3]|uniref:hypothetical protein n=1 Tax=Marinomonas sp. 2405UD68-3 TaxID=3391835 RepID=UPI0039C9101C